MIEMSLLCPPREVRGGHDVTVRIFSKETTTTNYEYIIYMRVKIAKKFYTENITKFFMRNIDKTF